jgi:hypothetical protein
MRRHTIAAVLLTLVAAAGCKGITYRSDYNTERDFTKYSTYAWNPIGNNLTNDPRFRGDIIEARIMRSTEKALAQVGLTAAASADRADLLVTFHAGVDARITATQVQTHYGYDYYWGSYAFGTTYQAYYDQGTIVLDMMENGPGGEDQLVYRGYATGGIKEKQREPQDMDRDMDRIMANIVANYPGR